MTYLRRRDDERRQREKSPIEVKQWRKIEAHVRRKLGFKQDKHSRKLGIDGVCEKIAFLGPDGVEVEEDKYWEYGDPAGRIEMHSDFFVDKMVLDPFLNFMESIIGAKINDTNFEFLMNADVNPAYTVFEWIVDQHHFQKVETVSFLEVKDWGKRVTIAEIDTFVGKLVRGGANEGVFVANSYTRTIKKEVHLLNQELKKIGKRLRLMVMRGVDLDSSLDRIQLEDY